jgi:hypothetical protein
LHTIRYEFTWGGGAPGTGGSGSLLVDGERVAEGTIERTEPFIYSADEGVDVGVDNETPVTDAYEQGNNQFTGRIRQVTVAIQPEAEPQ